MKSIPFRDIRTFVHVVFSAFLMLAVLPSAMAQSDQVTVLRGGTLLNVETGELTPDTTIVVEGNRISSIDAKRIPRGATVVDVSGKYIVPGLWDKHLHYKDWFGEMLLTNGVTSGYVQSGGGADFLHAQNEGIHKGKIKGPRMFFRERKFDVFDSVEEARQTTRDGIKKLNPSFVKVYTGIIPEHLKAVTEEADKAGLHVEGHIGISAFDAVNAGIDGLTHSTGIALAVLRDEDLAKVPDMRVFDTGRRLVQFPKIATWDESKTGSPNPDLTEFWLFLEDPRRAMMLGMMDRELARELIDLMVKNDVFMESNFTYMFRHVNDRVDQYRAEDYVFLNEPDLSYVPERIRINVLDYSLIDWATDEEMALMKQGFRNFEWFVKTFVNAGGKMIIGPDTSSPNHATMLPGITTVRELELLVDAGLTPLQAIQSGTIWPSQRLSKWEDLGSVEEGKLADILVLPGNPLDDITVYKNIEMVMQNGRFVELGYHFNYKNPIPWEHGGRVQFDDHVISEIPAYTTSISPAVVTEGGGDITLTVRGGPFISTSTIRLGDSLLETELVSDDEVRAVVPARLIQNVGTYEVTITHKAPGWGEMNSQYLIVKFK